MVKLLAEALLQQGLAGVIIIGMAVWIYKLTTKLNEVQEQRVTDAFRLANATNAVASALERNTETLNALLER